MASNKIRYFVYYCIYAAICLFLLVLQSTGLMTLQIGTMSALLVLPASVFAGFYFREFAGALFGFVFGALTDAYSATLCFNTIMLTLCGFICGLLVSRFFNSNLASAVVLNICASVLYFFIKWITIYAFKDPVPGYIFVHFTLPSAIYTAVTGVVLYFSINPIFQRMPIKRRH